MTVLLLLPALHGCRRPESAADTGQPLSGLTAAQLARFRAGEALFNHVFTPEEGVGPLFNENQCSACHTLPAAGGTGEQIVLKASRFEAADSCDNLSAEGGENIRRQATPLLKAHGVTRASVPKDATETARFTVPFLFGAGLIEAIRESAILRGTDPQDRDGDGISGRAGRDARGRLGRFGRKADFAAISDFVDSALRFEMGLTTPQHPTEVAAGDLPDGIDPARDPEISDQQVALLADFVRFLAPPRRVVPPTDSARAVTARGERLFNGARCAQCHVASLPTSSRGMAALDRKRIYLFSDLLLHDMGAGLAGTCSAAATPREWRTAPLMGLHSRRVFLHDGRALDLFEAIRLHGGEAERARRRFEHLNPLQQEDLVAFLRTL